jgi:hypothetical protein
MTKPVTSQDMFELWQKMVNPTGYPLQSLMFPVLDAKEIEKKIGELQVVEHWLRANLGMLQVSIKSLEYQRAMLKGGEKFSEHMRAAASDPDAAAVEGAPPNPAMWAWDMMAKASQDAMAQATQAAKAASAPAQPTKRKKPAK